MMVKSMLSNLLLECFKAFHVNSYMSNKLDNKQLLFVEEEKNCDRRNVRILPGLYWLGQKVCLYVLSEGREGGSSLFLFLQ